MDCFWRITLASAVGALSISPLQAEVSKKLSGNSAATQQEVQQVTQTGVSEVDKWLIKSDNNYKWALPPSDQPDQSIAADKPAAPLAPKTEASKKNTSYYRRSDSYATNPDSDPPRYVRKLSEIGVEAFKNITWLEIGFEHRTRYEMRHNDIRHVEGGFDNPFFLRDRAYLGIKEILDPFRFAVEFQYLANAPLNS